jgi:hypothetical protein
MPRLIPKRPKHGDTFSSTTASACCSSTQIDPPSEIEKLATERENAVVLTAPWDECDPQRLVERLSVLVYTPLPDTAEFLMQTYHGVHATPDGNGRLELMKHSSPEMAQGLSQSGASRMMLPTSSAYAHAGRGRRGPHVRGGSEE